MKSLGWSELANEGWGLLPVRSALFPQYEKHGSASGEYLSLMANVGVIPYAEKGDIGNKAPENMSKCKRVAKGDFVINSMNFGIGSFGVSNYDGICSPVYLVLKPNDQMFNTSFVSYIFQMKQFQQHAQSFGNGILAHRAAVGWDELKNISLPAPPLDEQKAIADFLDLELAQIDALIEKQEKLIANLIDRKASVITRHVNRGVSEKIGLWDSGVDWIGQIPSTWRVGRIKHACRLTLGKMVNQQNQEGALAPYVRAGNIQVSGLDLTETKHLPATDAEIRSLQIVRGDVLVVEGGAGYGRSVYLSEDLEGWIFQNHVIRLRPFLGFSGRYLDYFVKHLLSVGHFERLSSFATIPSVSADKLGNIELPMPSLDEQISISDHLDSIIADIDLMLIKSSKFVTILHERRQSIIAAAVTGKIDVRKVA